MDSTHPKSAFVYGQIRRALRSGRYAPGQRIDPGRLAIEFNTSPTPVRFALYRLVGEALIVDHARDGLHVPLLTEVAMRDLYDWMERLLLMACDIGVAPTAQETGMLEIASADDDLVKLTWQLFDAIARVTNHRSLHHAVKQANDRLAPIRWAKQGLLERGLEEFSELNRHWQARDIPALKSALHDSETKGVRFIYKHKQRGLRQNRKCNPKISTQLAATRFGAMPSFRLLAT